jgi:nucleoside phosphorylase
MKKLLIISATNRELKPIRNYLSHLYLGNALIDISFLTTGIGPNKTEQSLSGKLNKNQFDLVINIGTVGALSPDLHLNEIFFPTLFCAKVNESLETVKLSERLEEYLWSLPAPWKSGRLFSSDVPITSRQQKMQIIEVSNARAVDMEAFSAAKVCKKFEVPFLSIKVVTDMADSHAPASYLPQLKISVETLKEAVKLLIDNIIDNIGKHE